ncbi:hypothetical protein BCD48_23305 [Pseudofrankia sp. BMG5.36]|nr:hypothetical protein BCD48_23305 [Pseudofrankia sp. BMG5.36]
MGAGGVGQSAGAASAAGGPTPAAELSADPPREWPVPAGAGAAGHAQMTPWAAGAPDAPAAVTCAAAAPASAVESTPAAESTVVTESAAVAGAATAAPGATGVAVDVRPATADAGTASSTRARGSRSGRPAGVPVVGRRPTPAWAGMASLEGQTDDAPVRIARCCLPLPGDKLIGFVTSQNVNHSAVTLHRAECPNTRPSGPSGPVREPVEVLSWRCPEAHTFPAEIGVEAFDRYGLLADITEVLSDTATGLRAASTSTSEDRVAHARFTVEVTGPDQLDAVLAAVRTVGGVYDCFRACQTPG